MADVKVKKEAPAPAPQLGSIYICDVNGVDAEAGGSETAPFKTVLYAGTLTLFNPSISLLGTWLEIRYIFL